MILLGHPTGNSFVRALLNAFQREEMDYSFYTTLAFDKTRWWTNFITPRLRSELGRRSFDIPSERCRQRPGRELGRWLFSALRCDRFVAHEAGMFSVDAVYRDFDRFVAGEIRVGKLAGALRTIYAYEDGALETFTAARAMGAQCCYELPIAYWETSQRLLREEAERWPEWEPTLGATRDSARKLERKTQELTLADLIVCPSLFVQRSLPEAAREKSIVAEFGSPETNVPSRPAKEDSDRPLRVLFAGSMSQRKGLADLFAAMRFLQRSDVELVVMGTPILPMEFYRRQFPDFCHEPPRPHQEVLELMARCDLFVLPSIVEGRALVQQEAMSCSLPIIITPNTGGEDLVEPGETGFLVPIRAPEKIAEAIAWFADHRSALPEMREAARRKAAQYTWRRYADKILRRLSASLIPKARAAA